METIVLSDDEEEAGLRTGLCIHCGQVTKPHACPHGAAKIMKPLSKSKCRPAKKQRTSDVATSSATDGPAVAWRCAGSSSSSEPKMSSLIGTLRLVAAKSTS